MADTTLLSDEELEFLRQLRRNDVQFMIVGSAAAALQGVPVVTQDIDLWFEDLDDPGILAALKAVGATLVRPTGENPPFFAGPAVGLFDIVPEMHGLESFPNEKGSAPVVDLGGVQVSVLGLDRIIRSKRALGRVKDMAVLPALRATLATLKTLGASGNGQTRGTGRRKTRGSKP